MNCDCVVVGASFAGLACASSLTKAGYNVTVLERKSDPGEKLHTTGILVKDVLVQTPFLDDIPQQLVRKIPRVRLYAPNNNYIDLHAPGYYFMATDTPNVMRWLAEKAQRNGTTIKLGSPFSTVHRTDSGFDVDGVGTTRYLVGADGPRSTVAKSLGLGTVKKYLFGMEYELPNARLVERDTLHCFISKSFAPGYIGWVLQGVTGVQIGLALRIKRNGSALGELTHAKRSLRLFLQNVRSLFVDAIDVQAIEEHADVRAGFIPCGGLVSPLASHRALLVGDAAGMVSPLTAGGIHTALKHGATSGHAIAEFLGGKAEDPSTWYVNTYPRFTKKKLMRFALDNFQSDAIANMLINSSMFRRFASEVYFHRAEQQHSRTS